MHEGFPCQVAAPAVTRVRVYRDFAIWSNGVVSPVEARRWDDDMLPDTWNEGVDAAEAVMAMYPPRGLECCTECEQVGPCRGWDIFESDQYGTQIQRIDTCERFEWDDDAWAAAIAFFDEYAPPATTTTPVEETAHGQ